MFYVLDINLKPVAYNRIHINSMKHACHLKRFLDFKNQIMN